MSRRRQYCIRNLRKVNTQVRTYLHGVVERIALCNEIKDKEEEKQCEQQAIGFVTTCIVVVATERPPSLPSDIDSLLYSLVLDSVLSPERRIELGLSSLSSYRKAR